jgi:hypothetical protein
MNLENAIKLGRAAHKSGYYKISPGEGRTCFMASAPCPPWDDSGEDRWNEISEQEARAKWPDNEWDSVE